MNSDEANPYLKQLIVNAEKQVVKDLVEDKKNLNASALRQAYKLKHESLRALGSVITLDALHKRVSRASKAGGGENVPVSEVVATGSSVSSLSEAVSSTGSDSLTKQKVGRPKGSTKEKKVEEASRYKICVNEIVDSYFLEVNS